MIARMPHTHTHNISLLRCAASAAALIDRCASRGRRGMWRQYPLARAHTPEIRRLIGAHTHTLTKLVVVLSLCAAHIVQVHANRARPHQGIALALATAQPEGAPTSATRHGQQQQLHTIELAGHMLHNDSTARAKANIAIAHTQQVRAQTSLAPATIGVCVIGK